MSDTVDTASSARGNTRSRARGYVFTVNNYTESETQSILEFCKKNAKSWILGYEVGEEGTPHIQGYMYFENARTFESIKKAIPRAHIEKAKGSTEDNFKYCSKDGKYDASESINPRLDRLNKLYSNVTWRDWQQDIINIIEGPIDPRKIYWFWDKNGNIGKSYLCKYLYLKYNAIIASGKKNDVFNQIKTWLETNKNEMPSLVILDIPRTNLEYISYDCIEQIKNGLLYSGKYEGGICEFDTPHIVCFANEEPQYNKMSKDRWAVKNLPEREL